MVLDPPDVLEWLGTDHHGVGFYLHALNLRWDTEGTDSELRRFGAVARRLSEQPGYWSKVIRHDNWRYTLVGCVCALLARAPQFFDDLAWRFERGSFVVPQIGTTMGLLHPGETVPFLNDFLEAAEDDPVRSKTIVTARAVLARLGHPPKVSSIECDLDVLGRADASTARNVVRHHWEFWSRHAGDPRYLTTAP